MKTSTLASVFTFTMLFFLSAGLRAQTSVTRGAQVTSERGLVSGNDYLLQSQASGNPYIADAGTYYSIPNAGNQPTTASVYTLLQMNNGTWMLKNKLTGKFWGIPVYNQALVPANEPDAGVWSLNFSSGVAHPSAPDADGVVRYIDRSSQKLWGYTSGTSQAQRVKIFELGEAPLSELPLPELARKVVTLDEAPASDLAAGQWYVMFDRGYTGDYPHGYLYEQLSSHTLYNTATVPSGLATSAARFLVRLQDAGDGKYYVQDGFGNFFGAFTQAAVVPLTATAKESVIIDKIAATDGHFYLQSAATGIILDANDLSRGDATVVGWGSEAPTATGGNNDWAFYRVTLEDIGEEVALFEEDVQVWRGYQTCGRGNTDALMLRIDITPSQDMADATFTLALNEAAQAALSSLRLYETASTEFLANFPSEPLAVTDAVGAVASLTISGVAAGLHHYWLCATVRDDAPLATVLEATLQTIGYTTSKPMSLDVSAVGAPARQGMKVFERQHFVCRPTSDDCRFYRIPAMILDQNGNIVVAYDRRYNSNSDLGNHKIDVASLRSEDGGLTWQDAASVAVGDGYTAAYFGYGDAALARGTNGDLLCLMAAGSKMWGSNATDGMKYAGFARSSDNGKTWSLISNLLESPAFYDENSSDGSLSMGNFFTTSGKGLTTTDGVIMFTTNCRKTGTSSPNLIYVIYSTDNGYHWRMSNALAYSGGDESKLEQLNDGRLLLSVRQSGNRGWNYGRYRKNADGTVTFNWGEQYRTGDLWGNACNADILYYSRATEGQPDILLHTYINTSGRESLQLAMSINQGQSWQDVLNIQPNGSCYSTMVALPDGSVAILYEDASYDAGNGYAITYVTLSREQILEMFKRIGGVLPVGVRALSSNQEKHQSLPAEWFDLSGRRVSTPTRGIYISEGRKIVK